MIPNQNNIVGEYLVAKNESGQEIILYDPHPHQLDFHHSVAPNLLALGTRGTGKSLMLRMDAEMRCLAVPGFRALIVRRTMPELRRSHLVYIEREMKLLGGVFLHGVNTAKFPNGSSIVFAHCETDADILNFLSSEYGFIGFDELSTFTLNQFLQISAAARAPLDAPYTAVVRCGSNPLGIGADWMKAWFVDKTVKLEDFPDYLPDEYEMQFSTLNDNPSLNREAYTKKLQNLPEHVRRAWLYGEFVNEGSYFSDFDQFFGANTVKRLKEQNASSLVGDAQIGDPWHVISELPLWTDGRGRQQELFQYPWISVYRAIDWGFSPDPAVCLWIVVLPNQRAIVFKEMTWTRTVAKDVAKAIKRASEGMHIIETFADPSMFIKDGTIAFSVADIFEQNGIPLTASLNDRAKYGYSIHDFLNTIIDGKPRLQIVRPDGPFGSKELIRTLPLVQIDQNDPNKIANGNDHYVVALAYFCMGDAKPGRDPAKPKIPFWMKKPTRRSS